MFEYKPQAGELAITYHLRVQLLQLGVLLIRATEAVVSHGDFTSSRI